MAFTRGRVSRLALCLATSLAASTAVGQVYQPAAPSAPPSPNQPASYPYAPARPQAQPQPAYVPPAAPPAAAPPANYYGNAPAAAPAPPPATYGAPARPYQPAAAPAPIRRVGFDQPVGGQQPAADAGQPAAAQPVSQPAPAAQPAPAMQAPAGTPSSTPPSTVPAEVLAGQTANEHPLAPAIRWAREGYAHLDKLQDYSCTLVKRERVNGELGEHEYMFVKVRHKPFSVYMYFLGPARVKGQEALFVQGQNEGSLLAHGNGIRHRMIGTVSLKPTSNLAMSGNRYPITEMGMRRLLERLIEVGSNDMKYGECTVNWIQGAKVSNRVCTCIQVAHPVPRRNFIFHLARIYVDDELQFPIRYEAYDWPARQGDPPQLTEEYTFLNVKVNNGFTDADFSTENAAYGFK